MTEYTRYNSKTCFNLRISQKIESEYKTRCNQSIRPKYMLRDTTTPSPRPEKNQNIQKQCITSLISQVKYTKKP